MNTTLNVTVANTVFSNGSTKVSATLIDTGDKHINRYIDRYSGLVHKGED